MSVSERTELWRQKSGALISRLRFGAFSRLSSLSRFALEAALVAAIAYSASTLFLSAIAPDHQAVSSQNIAPTTTPTGSGGTVNSLAEQVFFRALDGSGANAAEINVKIKLFGTRPTSNGRGSAIIAMNGGVQKTVSPGMKLKNGVRVTGIFADRIEVIANGESGAIYLFDAKQRRQRSLLARNSFDESVLAALDLNFSTDGVSIGSNGKGALLETAGLAAGDMIAAINGKPVNSRGLLVDAIARAQNASTITLDIMRQDERLTRSFDVAALRNLLGSR